MIVILSKGTYEETTLEVQEWLEFYNCDHRRINGSDFLFESTYENDFVPDIVKDDKSVFWYRRWLEYDFTEEIVLDHLDSKEPKNLIRAKSHLSAELKTLGRNLFSRIPKDKCLNHPSEMAISKIAMLEKASELGLTIPSTLITGSKKKLLEFVEKHPRVITKNISDNQSYVNSDVDTDLTRSYFSLKTVEVDDELLSDLPNNFFPSIFQELILKKYELRIFYLDKSLYSMAIFSQLDSQTEIDFRVYNNERPNRTVPYQLPREIEKKLLVFCEELGITCGSFDLVRGMDGLYYFLEMNVVGQFGMTSGPCNYYLEEKVALHLKKLSEHENSK